jgi:polyhydroxyalkanoate synthesis repressor PhaR
LTLSSSRWSPDGSRSTREVRNLDKPPTSPVNPPSERSRRIIKRYSNRKLYDTRDSRYVTLLQIADMVRAGEDVQIIDNATKEDKTEVTLALIISEELKSQPRSVPLGTLRDLIHQRGEKLLTQLREGPIGRLIPAALDGKASEVGGGGSEPGKQAEIGGAAMAETIGAKGKGEGATKGEAKGLRMQGLVETSKHALDQWHAIDERIRAILPSFVGFMSLQSDVDKLTRRVAALEDELARRSPPKEGGSEG